MKLFIFYILFFCLTYSRAYAYLDPGTGSMILQVIVAGIATVGVIVASYWAKLKNLFKKIFKSYNKKK